MQCDLLKIVITLLQLQCALVVLETLEVSHLLSELAVGNI